MTPLKKRYIYSILRGGCSFLPVPLNTHSIHHAGVMNCIPCAVYHNFSEVLERTKAYHSTLLSNEEKSITNNNNKKRNEIIKKKETGIRILDWGASENRTFSRKILSCKTIKLAMRLKFLTPYSNAKKGSLYCVSLFLHSENLRKSYSSTHSREGKKEFPVLVNISLNELLQLLFRRIISSNNPPIL